MLAFNTLEDRLVGNLVSESWLDFVYSHLSPMRTVSRVMAKVVWVAKETPDIKRFVLKPNAHWSSFAAGQYVSVKVMIDGSYSERCYSLVSSPKDDLIEIAVKRQPKGRVSNWMHDSLRLGDVIELGEVGGEFVLPAQLPEKLLLIAGGSGITPIYSLLCSALDIRPDSDISVMYYVNTDQDLAFVKEMRALEVNYPSFKLSVALAESGDDGVFSREQLTERCADYRERSTYVCGPKGLMNAVQSVWEEQGIEEHLIQESFGLVLTDLDTASVEQPIMLRRSQQEFLNNKATILESAEAAGARPAFGCRMGVCKTCSCTKVSGVVRDLVTGAIDDQPNTQIRICVSEPLSDVVLDI